MSSPNPPAQQQQQKQQQNKQSSPIPTQFRAISRNNSNTSTTSSSYKGEFSSTLSTTNSVASSRSQLSRPFLDRQLLAACGGSSTPIRSFQRATISSVVKTRAFDNNPVLQGLLVSSSPSGQNSVSNSQTPSPLSTPVFSRSRSLRMSGGPNRYQQSSSSYYRTSSRTPDLYSFTNNSGDSSTDPNVKLVELHSEKSELKESLEFLEYERQALIDSNKELKETLQKERSQWKKEQDELKNHLTDAIASRIRAESQLTKLDVGSNEARNQIRNLNDDLQSRNKQLAQLTKSLETAHLEIRHLQALNIELKKMLTEKLKSNGLNTSAQFGPGSSGDNSDCSSIVTEMATLRVELNEKTKLIERLGGSQPKLASNSRPDSYSQYEVESLNKFLDQTVECIKGWPDELASSSHVQNLMKTLLSAYRPDQDDLSKRMENIHL